jgi:hypothetical protein
MVAAVWLNHQHRDDDYDIRLIVYILVLSSFLILKKGMITFNDENTTYIYTYICYFFENRV